MLNWSDLSRNWLQRKSSINRESHSFVIGESVGEWVGVGALKALACLLACLGHLYDTCLGKGWIDTVQACVVIMKVSILKLLGTPESNDPTYSVPNVHEPTG